MILQDNLITEDCSLNAREMFINLANNKSQMALVKVVWALFQNFFFLRLIALLNVNVVHNLSNFKINLNCLSFKNFLTS